jgi:hypothetical protein
MFIKSMDNIQGIINDKEIADVYTDLKSYEYKSMEMYNEYYYEIGLKSPSSRLDRDSPDYKYFKNNNIEYKLQEPSKEYCLNILIQYIEHILKETKTKFEDEKVKEMSIYKLQRMIIKKMIKATDNRSRPKSLNIKYSKLYYYENFNTLIKDLVGNFISLKIKSSVPFNIENYRDLANTFSFNYSFTFDKSLETYKNIDEIFPTYTFKFKKPRLNNKELEEPQFFESIFNRDLLDYYKIAVFSNDPFIRYISYYHIIEYYYDKLFRSDLADKFKESLDGQNLQQSSDLQIYEIAKLINKELYKEKEDLMLKNVLTKFVNKTELIDRIKEIDSELFERYQSKEVEFCKASIINWSEKEYIKTLSDRIYKTRNALVHSKSGQREKSYIHKRDYNELAKEIPLIKATAELIIIHSSEEIKSKGSN